VIATAPRATRPPAPIEHTRRFARAVALSIAASALIYAGAAWAVITAWKGLA